ncbi:hypothetical protein [Rhodococcus jostii]|uniref:hypothetical protein n=1 Tax=Rhodococcus jostii TaxID=132919 RepID=UPI003626D650
MGEALVGHPFLQLPAGALVRRLLGFGLLVDGPEVNAPQLDVRVHDQLGPPLVVVEQSHHAPHSSVQCLHGAGSRDWARRLFTERTLRWREFSG